MSNNIEDTTRIRTDINRINDSESLDTSFLDGRAKKKFEKNVFLKKKILNEKKNNGFISIVGKLLLLLFVFILLLFLLYLVIHNFDFKERFLLPF